MFASIIDRLAIFFIAAAGLVPGVWLSAVANRLSFLVWACSATAALLAVGYWAARKKAARAWSFGVVVLVVSVLLAALLAAHEEAVELGLRAVAPGALVGGSGREVGGLPFVLEPASWWVFGSLVALGSSGVSVRHRRLHSDRSRKTHASRPRGDRRGAPEERGR